MLRTSSIHVYDHFDLYLTPVTLTFNLPKKMFQMALLLLKGSVPNCFEIHALLYKLWSGQIWTDARTRHGCMHIHQTKIVTTMSRLPASGLDKNVQTTPTCTHCKHSKLVGCLDPKAIQHHHTT